MSSSTSAGKKSPKKSSSSNPDDSSSQKKRDKPKNANVIPVLKKSNKVAHIFGPNYYHSVKEAVFEVPLTPFLPPVIPEPLRLLNSDPETFYTCLQCKDSFRFSSTLEEHMSRRSWILGYWCQYCLLERCNHVPINTATCNGCVSAQFNRRAYLRSKGMKKGQKPAIIQIFYNQCAFFEHLKHHVVAAVEIGELMLMPLPSDIKKEDFEKLEKACKALMEYGFLNRIHIMEFLRQQKAGSQWWDVPPANENANNYQVELNLLGIIHSFRDRDFSIISVKKNVPSSSGNSTNKAPSSSSKNIPPANLAISTSSINDSTGSQCVSLPITKNLSIKYIHTPYRSPTDIAFVDCGPSHSLYKSQQLSSQSDSGQLPSSPSAPNSTKSPNQSQSDSYQLLTPISQPPSEFPKEPDSPARKRNVFGQFVKQSSQPSPQQPMTSILTTNSNQSNKVFTVSTCNTNSSSGPKISVKKFASEPVSNWGQSPNNVDKPKPQPPNINTKILTVHSEKCLDLSSIISQLPPEVINSKKIVFIEQNSNQIQYQKNSPQITSGPTLSANCIKLNVPQQKPATSRPSGSSQQIFKSKNKILSNPRKQNCATKPGLLLDPKILPQPSLVPITKNPTNIKIQQINPYDGKIFYQSGKKFVIKQTSKIKSTSIPASSILKPNPQARNVHTLIEIPGNLKPKPRILSKSKSIASNSPLTPSTSPSESSSSCDSQPVTFDDDTSIIKPYDNVKSQSAFDIKNLTEQETKLLSIRVCPASKLYLHLSEKLPIVLNRKSNLIKYKQNLLDTLPYLLTKDIQKRIDHINGISEEFLKALKITDHKIIDDHERFIGLLTDSVEQARILNIPQNTDKSKKETGKTSTMKTCQQVLESHPESDHQDHDDWDKQAMERCQFCLKLIKPNNYLPGFSKFSTDESRYCQCYNYYCKKCQTYQGSLSRFIAHKNYHSKKEPFTCPDCCRVFPTFLKLDRHLSLVCFHPQVKNHLFGCKICAIDGLTTVEALTRHFLFMHSKRGYVCSECKEIFFVESDCRIHLRLEHKNHDDQQQTDTKSGENGEKKSDPIPPHVVEIVMCKIGNCICLKENYTRHLIDHVGVEQQIFYNCPFCPFTKRDEPFMMEEFRGHMYNNHSALLIHLTSTSIIKEVQQYLKNNANSEIMPMIVNPRTIAQEAFEKGTQDDDTLDKSDSNMPMIVDVRSEAVNFIADDDDDSVPKILEVKSIANDSLLKKSQGPRKRKANTVIEITLSPKKISSVEIKNGKTNSKQSTKNPTNIRGICQVKEILLEKRSLDERDSEEVEIIEIEELDVDKADNASRAVNVDDSGDVDKTADVGKAPDVDKASDVDEASDKTVSVDKNVNVDKSTNAGKDKDINEDNENVTNSKEAAKRDEDINKVEHEGNKNKGHCEDEEEDLNEGIRDVNKNKDEDVDKCNEDVNKSREEKNGDNDESINAEKRDCNKEKEDTTDHKDLNENKDVIKDKEDLDKGKENASESNECSENARKNNEDFNQEDANQEKNDANQGEEDFNQEKENFNQRKEYVDKEKDVNQGEESGNRENFNQRKAEMAEYTESVIVGKEDENKDQTNMEKDQDINKDNIDTNQDNEDVSKNNEDINKDDVLNASTQDFSAEENTSKDNSNLNNDIEIINKGNKDLNEDNNAIKKDNDDINKDNADNNVIHTNNDDNDAINKNEGNSVISKCNENLNNDNENVNEGNENENFYTDNNTAENKDSVAEIEDASSFADNEATDHNVATDSSNKDINKSSKFIDNNNEFLIGNNELLTKGCESSTKDVTLNIDAEIVTKDTPFLNTDTQHLAEDDKISRKGIQCSVEDVSAEEESSNKNCQSSNEDYQATNRDHQSTNEDHQSKNEDHQSTKEDHQSTNPDYQSTNEDSHFSQEDIQFQNNDQSKTIQSLINDKSQEDEENVANSDKSEFLKENIQSSEKNEFLDKTNKSDNENEVSSKNSEIPNENNESSTTISEIVDNPTNIGIETKNQEIDNVEKGKNLVESEGNEGEHNLNALENLKAKMSRTFKTLAKRMEATNTTLQQECSKSLPMLKDISQTVENGSKCAFNEIRSRTRQRQRRRSDKWHTLTRSSENVSLRENISFPMKRGLRERITFDDDSSNSAEATNFGQDNSLDKNIRIDESKFKENFKIITQPPPPLSRIPQHILKSHSIDDTQTRRARKRKQSRIAFNGPLNYEETVLDFKCHICSKLIDSSWPVLKAHFDIWHPDEYTVTDLNPQLLKISSDYIDGGYKEILSKKFKCDTSPRKRKRRSRFTPKSPEKMALDKSAGICVTAEPVVEDDGMFKCKKCEMKFVDMDILRQHIGKCHRIRGRYLVCLECGENFVVAPSLQMHLKAFHAIDDPLTYLLQNTSFAPENLEDTEEEEEEVTIEANQCYVCMAVFEDKAAVDKHLRVHGMAFLNRKRIEAKKNLNSPEKKFTMASQSEDARCGNTSISLNPSQIQDDKQINVNQVLATNSLETEVSVH